MISQVALHLWNLTIRRWWIVSIPELIHYLPLRESPASIPKLIQWIPSGTDRKTIVLVKAHSMWLIQHKYWNHLILRNDYIIHLEGRSYGIIDDNTFSALKKWRESWVVKTEGDVFLWFMTIGSTLYHISEDYQVYVNCSCLWDTNIRIRQWGMAVFLSQSLSLHPIEQQRQMLLQYM